MALTAGRSGSNLVYLINSSGAGGEEQETRDGKVRPSIFQTNLCRSSTKYQLCCPSCLRLMSSNVRQECRENVNLLFEFVQTRSTL